MTPPRRHSIPLATGHLEIEVSRSDLPFEDLCGFAARRNPRRGFLFISRVLGRHLPVRPSVMRGAQTRLASRIPVDLPGPVVVLGLAETAIALAQGVHQVWTRLSGRKDVLFLHTTRYRLDAPLAFVFEEEHSHASRHLVYAPTDPADAALFRAAQSLVIVDDEASTGGTFVNLAQAFTSSPCRGTALQRIVCVTLTDWSPPFVARMPAETVVVSLLEGAYQFTPNDEARVVAMPHATGNDELKDLFIQRNRGRLGLRSSPGWAGALPAVAPGDRVLVLGTGEFTWLPFCLAERLEAAGVDVRCQSTTRSPIRLGHDVASCVAFPDNYDDGIPNFLYNYTPGQADRVFLCHETPSARMPPQIAESLGAIPLEM